jgi:FtsP/CotA-like multicopper oxidase with cupredoxin domain
MVSGIFFPSRRAVAAGITASLFPFWPASGQQPPAAGPAARGPRTLRAVPVRRRLSADASSEAELWTFGEDTVPVIRVRHGEEVAARLVNDTAAPLTLHWHGVRNLNAMDGVGGLTQAPVPPGGQFEYRFTPPDPGTSLVRPLVLGRSGEPAGRGLAALLVVEEREPPPVDGEYGLLVRDWGLEPDGALSPFGDTREAALAGRLGNRLAVAGGDAPSRIEAAPGSRLRLRLANACNARIMRIRFDNLRVLVGAVDGQPTETFEPLRASLPFPPGTRYDVFVELPREPGAEGAVTALIGPGVPLVALKTSAAAAPPAERKPIAAPPANSLLPPEIRLQNALRASLTIAGGATRAPSGDAVFTGDPKAVWTLNGAAGSVASRPLFTAKRGQPVVLAVTNRTGFPQPLHIHGHVVRQLHPLDDGWEPYWLDTIQVPEGKTVQVALLADNPGRWLIGSTVLERLDTGLWTWFEVA